MEDSKAVIEQATRRYLELLDALGLSTIAFPAIGAGAAGFSYDDVAIVMADVIADHLKSSRRPIHVTIYLFDRFRRKSPLDFVRFFEEFAVRVSGFPDHEAESEEHQDDTEETSVPIETSATLAADNAEAVERQRLVQRLGALGQERDRIEGRLAELKGELSEEEIRSMQSRLDEIHRQRLAILSELRRPAKEGVAVFVSYAHEDEELRIALGKHLAALERQGLITAWHDRRITAGSEWKGEIDQSLDSAGIVLLLVSADFINSDYCYDVEMKRAMERHEQRQGLVIPVILRPVVWKSAPFSKLQALPKDAKPVTKWANQDEAFVDITEGVRAAIEDFLIDRA